MGYHDRVRQVWKDVLISATNSINHEEMKIAGFFQSKISIAIGYG